LLRESRDRQVVRGDSAPGVAEGVHADGGAARGLGKARVAPCCVGDGRCGVVVGREGGAGRCRRAVGRDPGVQCGRGGHFYFLAQA